MAVVDTVVVYDNDVLLLLLTPELALSFETVVNCTTYCRNFQRLKFSALSGQVVMLCHCRLHSHYDALVRPGVGLLR